MLKRAWNSPTLMTWMSYSAKALSLFGVLPIVLKQFSPGDIVLWYLFSTIISLQSLADFGFRQTFARIISFAYGGARDIGVFLDSSSGENKIEDSGPNFDLLNSIISMMQFIYLRLTVVLFFLMGILGTWVLIKPINEASDFSGAWISWGVVFLVSCISFYGKMYLNFLEGLFKIALVRRVETFTSLGAVITSIIILFVAPSLLNLVIVNQIWFLIATFRDWYLCSVVDNRLYTKVSNRKPFDRVIFNQIWKPAWRSGISGIMSIGLTNITGLVYAQVGNTAAVASYLLALRIINQIKDISMAPFYSKLPVFAMLRVKGDIQRFILVARRGMLFSHLVFVVGVVFIGLFSSYLLNLLNSDVEFVPLPLWILLSIAFFIHRFGAMHMQVYLSTNHIISHIADGVSGVLFAAASFVLIPYVGIYAVPLGMLCGYLGFYAWYAARYSYASMDTNFLSFELKTSFVPLIIFVLYILIEKVIIKNF